MTESCGYFILAASIFAAIALDIIAGHLGRIAEALERKQNEQNH